MSKSAFGEIRVGFIRKDDGRIVSKGFYQSRGGLLSLNWSGRFDERVSAGLEEDSRQRFNDEFDGGSVRVGEEDERNAPIALRRGIEEEIEFEGDASRCCEFNFVRMAPQQREQLAKPVEIAGDDKPKPKRTDKKPGRNDPCPCGSGLKYKNCCGRN